MKINNIILSLIIVLFFLGLTGFVFSNFNEITGLVAGTPDLVANVSFSSADPTKSGVTVVTATVKNSGSAASDPSSFVIDLGLKKLWSFDIPVLAPDASMSFQVTPWLPAGRHSFAVYADSENQVSESNKLNNQVVDSLYIGKPSLALAEGSTSVTPSRLPFFTSPDLVVSDIIFSPEQPVTGDVVGANITVQNIGSAASDPSVLYVSGTRSGTWKLPVGALEPGESVVVNIPQLRPWFSLGVYTFTARADVDGQVSEADERNNVLQKTLVVSLPVFGTSTTSVLDKGNLTIFSDPSSANLYVDNIYRGVTPINLSGLSAGRHMVNISKDGFYPYNTTVNVELLSPLVLYASLDAPVILVNVSSIPDGTSLYVDGILKGITPINISLHRGLYNFKFNKAGYYDNESDLSILENTLVSMSLSPKPGYIQFTSSPDFADVYVNGILIGKTALNLTVTPGSYLVKMASTGFYDNESSITISNAQTIRLNMNLQPIPAKLNVFGYPGASLRIDGTYAGVLNIWDYPVSPGNHRVNVTLKYYYSKISDITVGPGETYDYHVDQLVSKPALVTINSNPNNVDAHVMVSYGKGGEILLEDIYGKTPLTIYSNANNNLVSSMVFIETHLSNAGYRNYDSMDQWTYTGAVKSYSISLVPK